MAEVILTDVTAASALALADGLYIVQGGNSRYATMQDVKNMMGQGWVHLNNLSYLTESNALTVLADTPTAFKGDADAPATETAYGGTKGTTVADWWDEDNGLLLSNAVGESYAFSLDFNVKKASASANEYIHIQFESTDSGAEQLISHFDLPLRKGAGAEHAFTTAFSTHITQSDLDNGIRIIFESTVEAEIWQPALFIRRDFVPTVPV